MKNRVKKHKNKSCWAKGEPKTTGSVYRKANVAVIATQIWKSEGSVGPQNDEHSSEQITVRGQNVAAGTPGLCRKHGPSQGEQWSCCSNEAAAAL